MAEQKKTTKIVDPQANAKKALDRAKQNKEGAQTAETSEIASIMGKTKEVTIGKDSGHPWKMTMRFPGTAVAQSIEDDNANQYGNMNIRGLMQRAIGEVIVAPKIESLSYFDHHVGFSEAAVQVLLFLNQGLNGQLN